MASEKRVYKTGDETIELQPSTKIAAVAVDSEAPGQADAQSVARAMKSEALGAEAVEKLGIVILSAGDQANGAMDASMAEAEGMESVSGSLPVFQMPGGAADEVMILIPRIRLQLVEGTEDEAVEALLEDYAVDVVARDDLGEGSMLLALRPESDQDALELSNSLNDSDLVAYAEPDWVYRQHKLAPASNDPLLATQWGLEKIRATQAWQIHRVTRT